MSATTVKTYADFVLPHTVVSRVDVSRLVREAERVDAALTTVSVRKKVGADKGGSNTAASIQLTEFLEMNKVEFTTSRERSQLIKQLRLLKDKVPVVHMTFAVTADVESLQKLVAWLRESVHPQAVIDVGLQPALVAGVYLRTPNHALDLSLRGQLAGRRDLLQKELEAARGKK